MPLFLGFNIENHYPYFEMKRLILETILTLLKLLLLEHIKTYPIFFTFMPCYPQRIILGMSDGVAVDGHHFTIVFVPVCQMDVAVIDQEHFIS